MAENPYMYFCFSRLSSHVNDLKSQWNDHLFALLNCCGHDESWQMLKKFQSPSIFCIYAVYIKSALGLGRKVRRQRQRAKWNPKEETNYSHYAQKDPEKDQKLCFLSEVMHVIIYIWLDMVCGACYRPLNGKVTNLPRLMLISVCKLVEREVNNGKKPLAWWFLCRYLQVCCFMLNSVLFRQLTETDCMDCPLSEISV